jgi:hypothetical protein
MGKSKTRILRKGKNNQITNMSRENAVDKTAEFLNTNNIPDAIDLITMFGLTAEEILEAGASYEAVTAIKNIFTK